MTDLAPNSHPDPAVLAAFVDGNVKGAELIELSRHLRECRECRLVAGEAARFQRVEPAATRPAGRFWWIAAAAAAAAIAAVIAVPLLVSRRAADPTSRLVAAAAATERRTPARLSGIAWSPLHSSTRAPHQAKTAGDLKLDGAAGDVLEATEHARSADERHARGLAHLLVGDLDRAVEELRAAANDKAPAPYWSDLAAAYYERATTRDRPADLPLALAATRKALDLQKDSLDALFNRALIIEALGPEGQAIEAWSSYLEKDSQSQWAGEARAHVQDLRSRKSATFDVLRRDVESALAQHDESKVQAVVSANRQLRALAEVEILGDWARAYRGLDTHAAERHLETAAAIASALDAASGERLLLDSVAAIRKANPSRANELAAAHLVYRDARLKLRDGSTSLAEPLFRDSARLFAGAGSPMALVARYYAAMAAVDQGRLDFGEETLRALLDRSVNDRHYFALEAQIRWEIGLIRLQKADWSAALDVLEQSAAGFERLREYSYLGFIRDLMSEAHDYLAEYDLAWQERVGALRLLSRYPTGNRLHVALTSASRSEWLAGRADAALALLELEIAESRQRASLVMLVDGYCRRAVLLEHEGQHVRAERSLADAHEALARIPDRAIQRQAQPALDIAEASCARPANPSRALALLDSMKTAEGTPNVIRSRFALERGRALLALNRSDEALTEFASGIDFVVRESRAVPDVSVRSGLLDSGEQLIEELVLLLHSRSDDYAAFAYAEAGRACDDAACVSQSTADRAGRALVAAVQPALRADQVFVSFFGTRSHMLAFVIDSSDFRVFDTAIDRGVLDDQIERLEGVIRNRRELAEVAPLATALYDELLRKPLEMNPHAESLVVVPDRSLNRVPFAALYDSARHGYVIERQTLAITPSAVEFGRSRSSETRDRRDQTVLIVAASAPSDAGDRLPFAEAEARAVASIYPNSMLLSGRDLSPERFATEASRAAIIHYAGHAEAGATAATLHLSPAGDVTASDIARMTLSGTQLAVLAGCETLRASRSHLQGPQTVAHAFVTAGVPAVVGTLWNVDDRDATTLFRAFHTAYRTCGDAAQALRQAQLAFLRNPSAGERHPYAWAGVETVIGKQRTTGKRGA